MMQYGNKVDERKEKGNGREGKRREEKEKKK